MAQGGIRKGFFFYFGLFILLLVAIFLIILVIMMFNPGKSILWMQYFNDSGNIRIVEVASDVEGEKPTTIDFREISNVEVNCSYADVYVQKNSEVKKDCVLIEVNAKGFATDKQATPFSYDVSLNNGTLKVSVTEPVGFIYLSKSINIYINVYDYGDEDLYGDTPAEEAYDFSNTSFSVKTTEGSVFLGNNTRECANIYPKSISVTTTSGLVNLSQYLRFDNIDALSVTTTSGDIVTNGNNVKFNATDDENNASGISVGNADVSLTTDSGDIDLDVVRVINGTFNINNESGNVIIDNIQVYNFSFSIFDEIIGDVPFGVSKNSINITCYEGNYVFDDVFGNINFTPSEDQIASPNIRINSLNGDFTLSSSRNTPDPDVRINSMVGNIYSTGTNGAFRINNLIGLAYIDAQSGMINLNFADQTSQTQVSGDISVSTLRTSSGEITVGYKGSIFDNLELWSESGTININVTSEASFTAVSKNFANTEDLANDKINVNVGSHSGSNNNLDVTGSGEGKGAISIHADERVNISLRDSIGSYFEF